MNNEATHTSNQLNAFPFDAPHRSFILLLQFIVSGWAAFQATGYCKPAA